MNVGFVGTGSMGTMLIEAFIRSAALRAEEITASNRTMAKVEQLAAKYPGLRTARTNAEVVKASDIVFICVKPLEYSKVIDDIHGIVHQEHIIISITSPVLIRRLEDRLNCKIAKVIPSITNYVLSGAALCMFGSRMNPEDCHTIERLLNHISSPIRIPERFARIASDLSSIGPACLAYFMRQFIEAAVRETGIEESEATRLAGEMMLGTGKLLTCGEFTPDHLEKRVTVPGGITAEALRMMAGYLDGMFEQLIRTTHDKYDEDVEKVDALLSKSHADL